jgi:hypothetical protein
MRRLAFIVLIASAVAVPGALATTAPTLRVVKATPFVVAGAHFRAHERVTVTLVTSTTRVRRVTSDRVGSFQADFGDVTFGRCAGFSLSARGAAGDVAVAKIPRPGCMPQRNP